MMAKCSQLTSSVAVIPIVVVNNSNPIRVRILNHISIGILNSCVVVTEGDNALSVILGDSVNNVPKHGVNKQVNIALLSIASTSDECMKSHEHIYIAAVARRCLCLPHLAVTDPCCLSRPSGYSANGVLIQLSRFDALTIAWLERFVKEWWSACQVAQCQGCLPYSVVGCLSSLLVEVSRLSSPLTGRVEILSTSKKSMG
jgi:hypothetical protein